MIRLSKYWHSFSHTLSENGYRAQSREIPADRSRCQASRIPILVCAWLRNPHLGLRGWFVLPTCTAVLPGFLDFCSLNQHATPLTTLDLGDQFSNSVYDAWRNYIPLRYKSILQFSFEGPVVECLIPHPPTYPVLPVNPLHPPVRLWHPSPSFFLHWSRLSFWLLHHPSRLWIASSSTLRSASHIQVEWVCFLSFVFIICHDR